MWLFDYLIKKQVTVPGTWEVEGRKTFDKQQKLEFLKDYDS